MYKVSFVTGANLRNSFYGKTGYRLCSLFASLLFYHETPFPSRRLGVKAVKACQGRGCPETCIS